ncbi:GNAT family protein [uncultured Maritalea sp.]|uniref:GNAT family N-acetyltransferase n=1 Tax=uncultured Maritalea sp. TaxID=757249 RepID=UPI00262CCAB9|nr:GNAT family protein [uncultured Maritalea sp.]
MLRTLFKKGQPIELKSDSLILRTPTLSDYEQWRALREASRKYLVPYEPTWNETELALSSFRERVRRAEREAVAEAAFAFFIHDISGASSKLVGGINLSDIRRRVAQTVNIGYWMGEQNANQGIMTKAVGMALPFIFDQLKLHRACAACLVDNQRSVRVLEKNGFVHEGRAEGYLKINGKWQDHLLFGLTKERFEFNRTG